MDTYFSHFDTDIIIEQDAFHVCFKQNVRKGEGTASIYPVIPGVEVIELKFHAPCYFPIVRRKMKIMKINHCAKGRMECKMHDGCLQYIGEGDLFMHTIHNQSSCIEFPLEYYCGIMVALDVKQVDSVIKRIFQNVPICIDQMMNRFFTEDECFLMRTKEDIQHIFSSMYTIPEEAKPDYYKLKVLELLIYLHYLNPSTEKQKKVYLPQQISTVKQIQKYITDNLSNRFTIKELAKQYCISPTALKTYFKEVYGKPIASYIKDYRIRQAGVLLRETNLSIGDIALSVGYESQSKFGVAFKDIMKVTPLEYRRLYS